MTRRYGPKKRLEIWLNKKLDDEVPDELGQFFKQINDAKLDMREVVRAAGESYKKWRLADAIAAAEHGDMRLLRSLYPHLVPFLQPPKRPGKGKRFPKDTKDKLRDIEWDPHLVDLTLAVKDAARIRAILKEQSIPRLKGDYSPEEIAARRWRVEPEAVHDWKKSRLLPKGK